MNHFSNLLLPLLGQENPAVSLMGEEAVVNVPSADTVPLRDWLGDTTPLMRMVETYDIKMQAPSMLVATILWSKMTVRAVLGKWLAHALLGNAVPISSDNIEVRGTDGGGLYWSSDNTRILHETEIAEACITLAQQYATTFVQLGVGKTDAWGNIGLAIADPWMSASKKNVSTEALIMSYENFLRLLNSELQASIIALPINDNGKTIVHFRRRKSCCHKYELTDKNNCTTCSKVPVETQIQQVLNKG